MRLKDKVVLVTGAGQGMGRAIARCFVQEGATVIALDLNLEAAQESLAGLGGPSVARSLDVGSSAAVTALVDEVVATGLLIRRPTYEEAMFAAMNGAVAPSIDDVKEVFL